MERAAAPVFVVFFALAGAELAPEAIAQSWYFVVPAVIVRIVGLRVGTWVGGRWARAPEEGRYVWMGLVSQAVVAINEILGPIFFRFALARAGEIVQDGPRDPAGH